MADDTAPPSRRQASAGFRWIAWARSRGLKGSQQAVLTTIATHLDREGAAFLTYDTIGRESGIHRATAIKAVKALLGAGLIIAAEQTNGRTANTYSMKTDAIQPSLFGGAPLETAPTPKKRRRVKTTVKNVENDSGDKRQPKGRLLAVYYGTSKTNERVAAMIDIGRALGVELDAGQLGAALKRGDAAEIAERLGVALFKNVELPLDFALKNLNGRGQHEKTRRADRRAPGTASDDAARLKAGDY